MTLANESRTSIPIPPGGAICGVYARSDHKRGVWKAPADQVIKNVIDVVQSVSTETNAVLNARGVNIIRDFGPRGIRVFGARTLSTDPELKYVNVRRYLIYLETSIWKGLQFVVFEPNADPLWAKIRGTIIHFLISEWRSGALMGGRAEEAYFVRCDRSTMTQNDIDSGRLVVEVGVAPIKPAEFVILRFKLLTAEARC